MPRNDYLTAVSEELLQAHRIFAQNILEARRGRGWTQAEAAGRCLLSLGAYRAAEEGRLGTAIGVYWVILDTFGLTDGITNLAAPHLDEVGRQFRKVSSKLKRSR